jgi:hypothetical protein
MSGTSYVQRQLDFTFTLQSGTFTGTGSNQLTVSGLRARADLTFMAKPSSFQMTGRVYGLPQSVMNDLSTMGKVIGDNKFNRVAVYAGDAVNGMSLVFEGNVYDAWGNYHDAPNVSFDITATTAIIDSISAVSPISYQGSVDVATILSSIASQMNPPRSFENNGVSVIVYNAYHPGTLTQQIQDICDMANINYSDDGQTLAIWPQGGSRGGAVPLISPTTGMVGYPTYTAQGIDIVTVFNPSIQFGGLVQVESSVKGANGNFHVGGIVHNLEAQNPGGSWFTAIRLIDPVVWQRQYAS